MRTLAIDPGTRCGYAWTDSGNVVAHQSGTWDLSSRRFEGGGMRFLRLRSHLEEIAPGLVVFEEVRRHLGTDAAHVYGGLVATIQTWCEDRVVPYSAIPVGTVKKRATGKGNAKKDAMVLAAQRDLGMLGDDDNQADALWLLVCALESFGVRSAA